MQNQLARSILLQTLGLVLALGPLFATEPLRIDPGAIPLESISLKSITSDGDRIERLALASFDTSTTPPRLHGHQSYQPGKQCHWFEAHGFGPDDSWIYVTANVMDTSVLHSDLARMPLATGDFQPLTFSADPKADEPGGYEQHAQFAKRFNVFSHSSSEAGRGKQEPWLASPEGTGRERVTWFKEEGTADHALVDGLWTVPSDTAWNPQLPAGREQQLLNLQVDFNPLQNASSRNEIVLVEFARRVDENPAPRPESADAIEIAQRNPMIHARGTRIVDGNDKPIQLRGVILEGWLMWNGTLWGAGLSSETKLSERIENLVGEEEAARFRTAVYDTFITERDIEMIADLGFNVVRVPFNHTVLEKNGQIDDSAPGWSYLDRLLAWCEKHQVYVVLDLHAVPGGQSGLFVADPEARQVWKSEEDLQRTIDLWGAIATRYRDRTVVAGYDLVNEPEPPRGQDLVDLYRRIIKAIRAVDPHHLVFLEGGGPASSDFSFYEGPIDANQAYSFHTYNLFSDATGKSHLERLAAMAEAHDVPLWNGEIGAHTDEWIRTQLEFFEEPRHHVNGWIFWPWKRVSESGWARDRFRHLMEIESTEAWDTVRKHLASVFGLKKIPKELARQALADFIEASKAENLIADERMIEVVRSWQRRKVPTPQQVEPDAQGPKSSTTLAGAATQQKMCEKEG